MPRSARRLYDALTLGRAGPAWPRACWVRAPARPRPRTAWAQRAARAARWCGWAAGRAAAGALVRTRVLAAEAAAPAAPEPWCAAVVAGARAALADILTEAGDRGVILGGAGAGAALAAALASTPRVRALLLLAPPLLTLAGERDTPDDPLAEIRLPMLVVAGTGAAQCWRGAARELTRGEAGARRLLELRGADDALRLPAALRRRLPQHALDAAVADECARWMIEIAESSNGESPPRERVRRRGASPAHSRRAALELERSYAGTDGDEDDYAHLPSAVAGRQEAEGERPAELVAEFPTRRGGAGALEAGGVALGAGAWCRGARGARRWRCCRRAASCPASSPGSRGPRWRPRTSCACPWCSQTTRPALR
ncbi:unnamed protein product [Chrysodeixis includens]|uniref:Uncharacterized protein n=1 Tax=Chrysodeixis includens TaxID=689277 RepID=A0A9P0C0U0_CHRIL|nr:unnamed protein product [Chrysodeixis includens]